MYKMNIKYIILYMNSDNIKNMSIIYIMYLTNYTN